MSKLHKYNNLVTKYQDESPLNRQVPLTQYNHNRYKSGGRIENQLEKASKILYNNEILAIYGGFFVKPHRLLRDCPYRKRQKITKLSGEEILMLVIKGFEKAALDKKGWVVSIGNFDGLHRGHQAILSEAQKVSIRLNAPGVMAITFEPHPTKILRPSKAPVSITPLNYKLHLFEEFGIDAVGVVQDCYELLNMPPADFVDKFLVDKISPAAVVEGQDFEFGYARSGNIETLAAMGKEKGFEVSAVQLSRMSFAKEQNEKVSSSLIRHFIEKGRIADVIAATGRPYRLIGSVISGRGVGRELGFPTANINPLDQMIPAEGVYAGWVQIAEDEIGASGRGERLAAVFSVGRAKTFSRQHPLLVEAHIIEPGFERDIYGKWLAMDFVAVVRKQRIFKSREELSAQIRSDCNAARDILNANVE